MQGGVAFPFQPVRAISGLIAARKGLRESLLTAATYGSAPVLFLLSQLPPFCPEAGPLHSLPVRRAAGFHRRRRRRWTTSHSWHRSLRSAVWKWRAGLPLGDASLAESLSASDPRPPLTLFELAI